VDNINCREMLQKVNREIKCMSYQLQRLVATDSFHTNIFVRRLTDIEVIEQQHMFFRINCKNQFSPLRFSFLQKETEFTKGKKVDLKIFISTSEKEPVESNNEKMMVNPEKFVFKSLNNEKFLCDYVYFCLYSLTGSSIQIKISFPSEDKTKDKLKQK